MRAVVVQNDENGQTLGGFLIDPTQKLPKFEVPITRQQEPITLRSLTFNAALQTIQTTEIIRMLIGKL